MARRGTRILAWGIVGALVLLIVLKYFVADVYPVQSASMYPTIFGGGKLDEWVLVAYDKSPKLKRFDLVVTKNPEGGKNPVVKRAVGLPNERLLVAGGDVLVDGRHLDATVQRPAPVAVFRDRLQDVSKYFQFKSELWTQEDGEWVVDATAVRPRSDGGMMLFHKKLGDGYIDPDHQRVPGTSQVNDGIVECEALLEDPFDPTYAVLRLLLTEEGDTFQLQIAPDAEGGGDAFVVRIVRESPHRVPTLLHEEPIPFLVGAWHHLWFANVDNHLSFELDHEHCFTVDYEENVPLLNRMGAKTVGPPVGFGAEGCRARFRAIAVLRDLYYTGEGRFAVTSLLSLGPDEFFLLGDNSGRSLDSRHFGPVRAVDIVGRPVAVVWPPSRFRWLH